MLPACVMGLISRFDASAFPYCEHPGSEGVVGVIEEDGRVDGVAAEADFEMKMRTGGTSCLSCQTDDFTCLHFLTCLHKVL